jgi:hypothetical protein
MIDSSQAFRIWRLLPLDHIAFRVVLGLFAGEWKKHLVRLRLKPPRRTTGGRLFVSRKLETDQSSSWSEEFDHAF